MKVCQLLLGRYQHVTVGFHQGQRGTEGGRKGEGGGRGTAALKKKEGSSGSVKSVIHHLGLNTYDLFVK